MAARLASRLILNHLAPPLRSTLLSRLAAPLPFLPSPNQSIPPPTGTFLEGCDFQHWSVIMKFPKNPKPSREEMIGIYVTTPAAVVGRKEEKEKIHSVDTTTPDGTGFGCLISEDLIDKLKGLPGVLRDLPDSPIEVLNRDYRVDLFVDGKAVPWLQYRYNRDNTLSLVTAVSGAAENEGGR